MPGFLAFVALALAVGALSYVAWISLQSLLQARLLFRVRELARGPGPDGRMALRGRVRVDEPLRLHGAGPVLWRRAVHQVLVRSGKNRRWKTVHEEVDLASFVLVADGREVGLHEPPTEVQAVRSRTDYDEPGGCLGGHERRVLLQWLPMASALTAVGRLEGRAGAWRLARDNKVGLLLSPRDPESAAWVEVAKGLGGLVVVTVLTALGIWLYYSRSL